MSIALSGTWLKRFLVFLNSISHSNRIAKQTISESMEIRLIWMALAIAKAWASSAFSVVNDSACELALRSTATHLPAHSDFCHSYTLQKWRSFSRISAEMRTNRTYSVLWSSSNGPNKMIGMKKKIRMNAAARTVSCGWFITRSLWFYNFWPRWMRWQL